MFCKTPKSTIDAKCLKNYSQVTELPPNMGFLSDIRQTLRWFERRDARYREGFKESLIEYLLSVVLALD